MELKTFYSCNINKQDKYINLMKGKATRKHNLHGNTAVSVLKYKCCLRTGIEPVPSTKLYEQ